MLTKTEKGRHELRPGHRGLGQRERALLLVSDGQHSESQMATLFNGEGRRLLDQLLEQGYLERRITRLGRNDERDTIATPPTSGRAPERVSATPAAAATGHGDPFSGSRSVASARMFLFDLSERIFGLRDKALAHHYREALREARDPQAMLAVSRLMMTDVEVLAGTARAQSITERLNRLLPAELL